MWTTANGVPSGIVRLDVASQPAAGSHSIMRDLVCSSHTISGVMPGGPTAARHPLEERLAACSAAGYSGLWFHYRDFLEQRAAGRSSTELRELFDAHSIRHRGVEFLTDWFVGTAEAEAVVDAAMDAAGTIGATLLSVGGDFAGRGLPRALMVKRFADFCARAADDGISIALEFVPWSDVPDIRSALEFMEPANAGLVVDAWHLFRAGIPLSDIALIPPGKVLAIQLADAAAVPKAPLPEDTRNRLACGEGTLNLKGFLVALTDVARDVPVSVEIISPRFAAMSAEEAAQASIRGAAALLRPDAGGIA